MKRDAVVRLRSVGLEYEITMEGGNTLKSAVLDRLRGRAANRRRAVWALRDVTFDIEPGERVGVVGANGSGKSTLFRVIAGILPPTEGALEVSGTVVPLFQLGLGFKRDLTLQENIMHSGALLGMAPEEVRDRSEEIFAFSELGDLANAPLKVLSSGMMMRLAFTTATSMSPDVLLLDEVFAVGDASFVQRAMKRLDRLAERTQILMVISHSDAVIQRLCNRAFWLERGQVLCDDDPTTTLARYAESVRQGDRP